jgi:hypothetical protein
LRVTAGKARALEAKPLRGTSAYRLGSAARTGSAFGERPERRRRSLAADVDAR